MYSTETLIKRTSLNSSDSNVNEKENAQKIWTEMKDNAQT